MYGVYGHVLVTQSISFAAQPARSKSPGWALLLRQTCVMTQGFFACAILIVAGVANNTTTAPVPPCSTIQSPEECQAACTAVYASPDHLWRDPSLEGVYCSADGTSSTSCCEGQAPTITTTTEGSLLLGAPVSCSTVHSKADCQAACTATYGSPSNQYSSLTIGGVVQMDCSQDGTSETSCCVDDSSSEPSSVSAVATTLALLSLYLL